MFTMGLEIDSRGYFNSVTMLISIPTGSKMFNWLCTYFMVIIGHRMLINIKVFLGTFTIGGITGIILGNNVIDVSLHDSYYVMSHFHMVLSIGSIITIIIGVKAYTESLCNDMCCILSILSMYYYHVTLLGIIVTFISMHYVSFNSQPRRMMDFADSLGCWNSIVCHGSYLT
jgi:heme/copper-type cytochrome/quinol oxidase subunit 1